MTPYQEKALLEFVEALARTASVSAWAKEDVVQTARVFLASLEPQREPKRSAEDTLRAAKDLIPEGGYAARAGVDHALSLLCVDRERVERVAKEMRSVHAETLAQRPGWKNDWPLIWASRLERRDA